MLPKFSCFLCGCMFEAHRACDLHFMYSGVLPELSRNAECMVTNSQGHYKARSWLHWSCFKKSRRLCLVCPSTTDWSVQLGVHKMACQESKQATASMLLPLPCKFACRTCLCRWHKTLPRILDLIFCNSNSVHKFTHRGLSFCCSSVSLFTTFLYLPGNSQLSHVNLVPNHAPEIHATRKCKSSIYTQYKAMSLSHPWKKSRISILHATRILCFSSSCPHKLHNTLKFESKFDNSSVSNLCHSLKLA